MATILQKIAGQVLSRTTFSILAMDRARDAVVDTIGCMIAGRGDESVTALTRAFHGEVAGGGEARLVTGSSTSPSFAALVSRAIPSPISIVLPAKRIRLRTRAKLNIFR
jgi:2-methylcitrate dehydratase PrpD